MAVFTFTSAAGEGWINKTATTFAACRGAATGDGAYTAQIVIRTQRASASDWPIDRAYFPIDTSSLAGKTIVSAYLKLYRDDSIATMANADTTALHIIVTTEANTSSLATSDFSLVTFTSKGSLNLSSTSNNAYNNITITDLSIINQSGYTKLGVINSLDLNNSAPTADNLFAAQARGGANPPTLVVTTSGGGFFTFM
jgi:hypothetical protein